jgi:urease accessory protein
MLITEKIGHINSLKINNRSIDWLAVEWFEARKRILSKQTTSGKNISIKFLNENPDLTQGDVLFADEQTIIAIEILACSCMVIQPKNMFEMASVCYEIGNKHLPLFFEDDAVLVPYEEPLFKLLSVQGYRVIKEDRKLLQSLKTSVSPHGGSTGESLFSKIMKLKSAGSTQ